MKIEENVELKKYNTWHVGGPAQYFITAKKEEDVSAAVKFAEKKNKKFFVLGLGSNVLFSDEGYDGVVIKMENRELKANKNIVTADSGVFMRPLVNFCHNNNLYGLEELAGIPGTVGGAVCGNAGTQQSEIKDLIKKVRVLLYEDEKWLIKDMSRKECEFDYRDSIFKRSANRVIISVTFKLKRGDINKATKKMALDLVKRKMTQPLSAPSAGSVFKNPDVKNKVYAGKLIEEAGLKGKQIGGAQVSAKHANFIVNRGGAKGRDILKLIEVIKDKVKEKFNIDLELEVRVVAK